MTKVLTHKEEGGERVIIPRKNGTPPLRALQVEEGATQ